MSFKQSNWAEILDSEREMVLQGEQRFGAYYVNAVLISGLLARCVKSARPDRWIFGLFLSQVRKHHTLALFSSVRLHRTQAMMDLRQTLEAGACAAYSIANTDPADFADVDEFGILDPSKKLTSRRYTWLDENFKEESATIKRLKQNINESSAHSNIGDGYRNFQFSQDNRSADTPFFDLEDEYFVKTDLWLIANVGIGLMRLFFRANKSLDAIVFADDFEARLKELTIENNRLRTETMQTIGYKKANEIINKRARARAQET
jgi:hypothetical protein